MMMIVVVEIDIEVKIKWIVDRLLADEEIQWICVISRPVLPSFCRFVE